MMDLEEESDGLGGQKRDGHAKGEKRKDQLGGFTWMLCVSWICDTASVVSAKIDMQMIHRAPPL